MALSRTSVRTALPAVALVLTACGCSAAGPHAIGTPATTGNTPTLSAPTLSALTPTAPARFVTPATGCVLPAEQVARASGYTGLSTAELPATPGRPGEVLRLCQYRSGARSVAAIGIQLDPVRLGTTARQYLAADLASGNYNFGWSGTVPGLGDAAEFGTAHCATGTCGSISLIQIRGDTVAHLLVTVADPTGAQDPPVTLSRAVLTALST